MEIATLEAQITELVGHMNCANYRLLALLAAAAPPNLHVEPTMLEAAQRAVELAA